MRKKLNIVLFILVWLGCGTLGSFIGMEILRSERCVTTSDLCLAGALVTLGPINLFVTPIATGAKVLGRRSPDGCIFEKHGGGE